MNAPFLPIFNSPSQVVAETAEFGGVGIKTIQGNQQEGSVPFAEVLGESQQAQEQYKDTSGAPFGEENFLQASVFNEPDIIDELVIPALIQDELTEAVVVQIVPHTQVEAVNKLVSTATHPIEKQNPVPQVVEPVSSLAHFAVGHSGPTTPAQNLVQPTVQVPGYAPSVAGEAVTQEKIGQTGHTLESQPTLTQVVKQGEAVRHPKIRLTTNEEAVGDSGLRVRPLLNEPTQPNLNVRPPSNLVNSAFDALDAHVQRQLSTQDASVNNLKIDSGSLVVNQVLSHPREEVSQLFTRTDSEVKTAGAVGISQGGETGLGTAGGGLPFGNHTGNGQGPILESSTGTLASANQGQVAVERWEL